MRAFRNANPKNVREAVSVLDQAHSQGQSTSIVGGGSDLLGMAKEHLVSPDVLVNLKSIHGMDRIESQHGGVKIGGLTTLDNLLRDARVRKEYTVLAEAAENVGTPQIRNAGTLAGNVCQRPWCWYFRNGFPCLKNGGKICFSASGENQFHAIFGGGPSYIVHPSDTAPALVALDAEFHITGPKGERVLPASEFFQLPRVDASRENVLAKDEILTAVKLLAPRPGTRSTYHKVLDREAWTHAVVSAAIVLETDQQKICRGARVVLGGVAPIPWRLPKVEAMLVGQRITPELAAEAGVAAVEGAHPLARNKYKVPLTRAVVKRTLVSLT
ncbi:MAG TPA: xanthine dehydrogenase family protein subunit M, partial [Bryobacteraceae bacterium]|nr:xanthine dehydrogenase family protein subunit M [Bryobacteraceae bacterium]